MKVVELIVHEQRQTTTIPEKCPHCDTQVTVFSAIGNAAGRVDYDEEGNAIDSDLADYADDDLVYNVLCDECREDLVPVPVIHGAGLITTWHLQCLASFLAGYADWRAAQRLVDELQPAITIGDAWESAIQEDRQRQRCRRRTA